MPRGRQVGARKLERQEADKNECQEANVPHRGAVGKDMGGEEIWGFGMRPNGYRCNTEILHYTH